VVLDAKTGAYKWHFQSIRHDIWDMDNTHAPVLADVRIHGKMRKALYYGSKSGHIFVLDRTNSASLLGVDEKPLTQDARQLNPATQPFPSQGGWIPHCVVYQPLDPKNVPGHPWRAVRTTTATSPTRTANASTRRRTIWTPICLS
jgi:hypothetical protein